MADINNSNTPTSAIMGWVFAVISVSELDAMVRIIAGLIAIVSGIMAIRYYYYQTKKIKK